MTTVPVAEPPPRESLGRRLSTFFYRHPRVRLLLLLALPLAWLVVVYFGSLVVLLLSSLWDTEPLTRDIVHDPTLENFRRMIETPVYRDVAWRTIQMAASSRSRTRSSRFRSRTTWRASPRLERATCSSSRSSCRSGRTISSRPSPGGRSSPTGAWSTGRSGRSDSTFDGLSTVGLWLVFTYLWLPFMILPIYAGLERIPDSLLEASADLGGRSFRRSRA